MLFIYCISEKVYNKFFEPIVEDLFACLFEALGPEVVDISLRGHDHNILIRLE
jgi:hypothetical protein